MRRFFDHERPEFVFLAAAKVGGIFATNSSPAEVAYSNLQIQNNIVHSSYLCNVKKLMFLGSSCIYPKFAPQPMREDSLLSGHLEETNKAYALAKIAGISMGSVTRRSAPKADAPRSVAASSYCLPMVASRARTNTAG